MMDEDSYSAYQDRRIFIIVNEFKKSKLKQRV